MNTIISVLFVAFLITVAAIAKDIPVDELGSKYQITGKLHFPLGQVLAIEGTIERGKDGSPQINVHKIKNHPVRESIQISTAPYYGTWESRTQEVPQTGQDYECVGYETGGFDSNSMDINRPELVFHTHFEIFKSKRVQPANSYNPNQMPVSLNKPGLIPADQLGREYNLIGKAGVPLGKTVVLKGKIIEGFHKGYEDGPNLEIMDVNGVPPKKPLRIVIKPNWPGWNADANNRTRFDLSKKLVGKFCEMEGYETGEYVGMPDNNVPGLDVAQSTRYYFHEEFVACKFKEIPKR
jgi:hypothetical protein